jgi:hypothetical protein
MAKKKRRFKQDSRFTERSYRPYVLGIGQLALAWNDLHEKFGEIFVVVMEGNTAEDNFEITYQLAAVWSAANSDRTKRNMLKAALAEPRKLEGGPFPKLKEDISWLLGQATKLEDIRNDIIHAPLYSLVDSSPNVSLVSQYFSLQVGAEVIPNLLLQNTRAAKLVDKNMKGQMLADFRWCRDSVLVLRDYAGQIKWALTIDERAWPGRPQMPNRGQKKTVLRRQPAAK